MATGGKARPDCPNASNPYHICADYCSRAGSKLPSPVANEKKGKRDHKKAGEKRHVEPRCVNASNRYHVSAADFSKKMSNPVAHKTRGRVGHGDIRKEDGKNKIEEGLHVNPRCVDAYHVCASYCFEKMADMAIHKPTKREQTKGDLAARENTKKIQDQDQGNGGKAGFFTAAGVSKADLEMAAAGGSNEDAELAAAGGSKEHAEMAAADGSKQHAEMAAAARSKEHAEMAAAARSKEHLEMAAAGGSNEHVEMADRRDARPNCVSASLKTGETKKMNPMCPNSSNPYHICVDSCLKKIKVQDRGNGAKVVLFSAAGGSKERVERAERMDVRPNCVNASNPYHKCAKHCSQRSQEPNKARGGRSPVAAGGSKEHLQVAERNEVHPNCINASNPYHKCAEYCFQRINRTL